MPSAPARLPAASTTVHAGSPPRPEHVQPLDAILSSTGAPDFVNDLAKSYVSANVCLLLFLLNYPGSSDQKHSMVVLGVFQAVLSRQ
jgi:hypothetical protein